MTRAGAVRRRLAAALLLALGGCTADVFFFSFKRHEGPYELRDTVVARDRYDPQGVYVPGLDGKRVHLLPVQASGARPDRAAVTVLFCHGNGGNLGTGGQFARVEALHQMGYRVLAFDYPGYGNSEGSPTEEGVYQAAEAAFAYLRDTLGAAPGSVVLYGHSLGAAACTELAYRHAGQVRALVLESPFRSIKDLVQDSAGASIPYEALTTLRFDNYFKIPEIRAPLLVIHGTADTYLQPRYGQELFEHAAEPKDLWLVEGADHGGCPGDLGTAERDAYLGRVTAFLDAR